MHYDLFTTFPFLAPLGIFAYFLVGVLVLWSLAIKGIALWKAARNGHTAWFAFLLIVNSLGIFELIYIFGFAKPPVKTAPAPAPAPIPSGPEA
ncbi:MAG: hypothetical protein JWO84_356 [Parcubacteria group bacterium]|nr:hypothetical protein [Parcubacteria group bacterium]